MDEPPFGRRSWAVYKHISMISSASRRMCARQKWRNCSGWSAIHYRERLSSTSMLTNADFKFKPAKDSKGNMIDVTQGTYSAICCTTLIARHAALLMKITWINTSSTRIRWPAILRIRSKPMCFICAPANMNRHSPRRCSI